MDAAPGRLQEAHSDALAQRMLQPSSRYHSRIVIRLRRLQRGQGNDAAHARIFAGSAGESPGSFADPIRCSFLRIPRDRGSAGRGGRSSPPSARRREAGSGRSRSRVGASEERASVRFPCHPIRSKRVERGSSDCSARRRTEAGRGRDCHKTCIHPRSPTRG
jgi:hypothetical protein